MKARLLAGSGAALAIALAAVLASQAVNAAPAPGPIIPVPAKADNFMLIDQTGFGHDLLNYREAPAIVIVAQANGDAVSRKAAKALQALQSMFGQVQFFMLNSSLKDTRETIAQEAKAQGIALPILDDNLQLVGESLGVTQTGEAFLIDPISMKIVYHGAIDADFARSKSDNYFLLNALVAQTSHRPIDVGSTPAKGTPISFPERDNKAMFANISYSKTVAPILQERCVECHQEGERDAGGFLPGEARRHVHRLVRLHQRGLREGAGAAAHHAVARAECGDASARRDDLARAFAAGRFPGAGFASCFARGQELAPVQAGRVQAHQQLPCAGSGLGRLAQLQLRAAGACLHPVGLHVLSFVIDAPMLPARGILARDQRQGGHACSPCRSERGVRIPCW